MPGSISSSMELLKRRDDIREVMEGDANGEDGREKWRVVVVVVVAPKVETVMHDDGDEA